MQSKTKRLTVSALMVAIAVILELGGRILLPPMPFGGQLTLAAMLPIVVASYLYGVRWGLVTGFTYSLVQMALGTGTVTAAFQPGYFGDGTMVLNALTMCLLDYVAAYTVLGLGGLFRNKLRHTGVEQIPHSHVPAELCLGSVLALSCRYLVHVLSGYILFSGWAEWFFTQEGFPAWGAGLVSALSPQALGWVYSIVYNGMYMIPELIITAIAAVFVGRIPIIANTEV